MISDLLTKPGCRLPVPRQTAAGQNFGTRCPRIHRDSGDEHGQSRRACWRWMSRWRLSRRWAGRSRFSAASGLFQPQLASSAL